MVIYVGGVEHTVILGNYLFLKLSNSEFFCLFFSLELVCCKKRQKFVPDQLLVWGIRAL